MNERLSGRQPVQVAELIQPLCGHQFSKGRCRAGGGVISVNGSFSWPTDDVEGWTFGGQPAVASPTGAGLAFRPTSNSVTFTSPTLDPGFSGDTYRYVVVRGRVPTAPTDVDWLLEYSGYSAGESMAPVNSAELKLLPAGSDFAAVFDAQDSADYATAWQGQTLINYRLTVSQPAGNIPDFNVYSVSPCTENPLDNLASACFNTLGSCQSEADYSERPDELLEPTHVYAQLDPIPFADINADWQTFYKLDVTFPDEAASGCIIENGGATIGFYFGVTGSNLLCRAFASNTDQKEVNNAFIEIPVAQFLGKRWIFYVEVIMEPGRLRVYAWDELERTLTLLGEDTAASPTTTWASSDVGGVGFGNSSWPVGADGTAFNGTVDSCQLYNEAALFVAGDYVVNLFFSHGTVGARDIPGTPYIIPALNQVGSASARLNLATADDDAQGIGNRAVITFNLNDFPHTDRLVDPYLAFRDYNALERSTFWPKWLSRNKFRYNMGMRSYEGYKGQTLAEMTQRLVLMQSTSGPTESGQVTLSGRDPLGLIEEKRAQVPQTSPGELLQALSAGGLLIEIAGATLADYPAPGTVRIGDELITYSAAVLNGATVELTVTQRGSDNTTAAAHSIEDRVQYCVRYETQRVDGVVRDLLISKGGIDRQFVNVDLLTEVANNDLALFNVQTVLSEPTSVTQLISELQEQCGLNIWWDERSKLVQFSSNGPRAEGPTLSDALNILEGSFAVKDLPRRRLSQVWFYFARKSPVASLEEPASFDFSYVAADLPSESPSQNGTPSIRKIFSRWIDSRSLAQSTASQLVSRFADVPQALTLSVDAKDGYLWLGDVVTVSHYLLVNPDGTRSETNWIITEAEVKEHGDIVRYTMEIADSFGVAARIQEPGASDYTPGADKTLVWIGDPSGLLSDGTDSSRIG